MKWRVLLTVVLGLAGVAGWAQDSKFAIWHVSVHLPNITAYLEVPEENGKPSKIEVADISAATIQGQPLKLNNLSVTKGFAYTLLLDVSKSIKRPEQIQAAITRWIDGLGPDDHLDIFVFGKDCTQLGTPASDKATLRSEVEKQPFDQLTTHVYSAVEKGIENAERTDAGLPRGRVLVILTDGKDESGSPDQIVAHENDLLHKIESSDVPIYAIGYSRGQNSSVEQDKYLKELTLLADKSRGFYDCAGVSWPSAYCPSHGVTSEQSPAKLSRKLPKVSLQNSFQNLSRRMERNFVVNMTCYECQPSDSHDLQISLRNGMSAQIPVALALLPVPPPPRGAPTWVYFLAIMLLLVAVVVVWLALKKKPPPEPQPEVVEPIPLPAPDAGIPAHFTVVSGPEPGRVYKVSLGAKTVIGRDSGCEVVLLDDKEISGRHCELTRNGTRIEVADLGSMNGTLLNGARVVARQRIEDGDLIRVGRTEFRVRFGEH